MVTIWFEPHGTTFDNEAEISSGWNDVDLSGKSLQTAITDIKQWQPGWQYRLQ